MTAKIWPTALTSIRKSTLLGVAALGAAGALALSPAAAFAADGTAPPAATKIANIDGALQPNGWYCGPAATRIALSAHDKTPTFDDLAGDLNTTRSGTNSIDDITRVLNANHGSERYASVKLADRDADAGQTDKLRTDVIAAVNDGDPVVANIAGTVTDTAGQRHSYEGGHYLTITGYTEGGNQVTITDPADRVGSNEYQVSVDDMADWTATRGYTH